MFVVAARGNRYLIVTVSPFNPSPTGARTQEINTAFQTLYEWNLHKNIYDEVKGERELTNVSSAKSSSWLYQYQKENSNSYVRILHTFLILFNSPWSLHLKYPSTITPKKSKGWILTHVKHWDLEFDSENSDFHPYLHRLWPFHALSHMQFSFTHFLVTSLYKAIILVSRFCSTQCKKATMCTGKSEKRQTHGADLFITVLCNFIYTWVHVDLWFFFQGLRC